METDNSGNTDIRRKLRNFFIPSLQNQLRPYSLRYKTLAFIIILSISLELAFFAYINIAFKKNVLLGNIISGIQSTVAEILPEIIIKETNDYREKNRLAPLSANPALSQAARLKAEDMSKRKYFAHQSPDGSMAWDWMKQAHYDFSYAGENLAVNFFDARDVVRAWMDSVTHRENILNKDFQQVGIGVARGVYNGRETVYVVQLFGTPPVPDQLYQRYASESGGETGMKPGRTPVAPKAPSRSMAQTATGTAMGTVKVAVAGTSSTSTLLAVARSSSTHPGQIGASATPAISAIKPVKISMAARWMVSPRHLIRDAFAILIIYIALSLLIPMSIIFRNHQSPDWGLRFREIGILFKRSIISSAVTLFVMACLLGFNYYWSRTGASVFQSATDGISKRI